MSHSPLVVTSLQIFPLPVDNQGSKLKAYVRVVLNDQLQLTSLRIYEGSKGLFVAYPNDPAHKGEDYRQLFYPVSRELRDHIEAKVLEEYTKQIQSNPF